jgi:hypothetical protein
MSSLTCDKGKKNLNKKFNHKGFIIIGWWKLKLIEQQQYSCITTMGIKGGGEEGE